MICDSKRNDNIDSAFVPKLDFVVVSPFQNGKAIEPGREDGDEEERARPEDRLHRLEAAGPLRGGQVKTDNQGGAKPSKSGCPWWNFIYFGGMSVIEEWKQSGLF